eukprot:s5777_g3.t1
MTGRKEGERPNKHCLTRKQQGACTGQLDEIAAEAVERLDDWTMPPTGRKWCRRHDFKPHVSQIGCLELEEGGKLAEGGDGRQCQSRRLKSINAKTDKKWWHSSMVAKSWRWPST